jgi:heme-degrading monooxygenase HmoA
MRTAILVAKMRTGGWKLLGTPSDSLMEVKKKFKEFMGNKVHKDFERVHYQESDSHLLVIQFRSPQEHEAFTANRDKETQQAVAAGKAEEENKSKASKEPDERRAKEHADEIDRLNGLVTDEVRKGKSADEKADPAPENHPFDANGLCTDGPTPEVWVAQGYDIKNYPPKGYAAKPAAAAKKSAATNKNENEN